MKNDRQVRSNPIWKAGPYSQFFQSPEEWQAEPSARVYGHQLRRAWDRKNGFGLWAILCVEGKPAVYFKRVSSPNFELENEWQRRLWNQGAATMLVVEDAREVRIYSGLARPQQPPAMGDDDARLVAVLDRIAASLELANFVRSVETGQFYRDYSVKFRSDQAIDQYLLDNLGTARDELCDDKSESPLQPSTAHAFLGRCLFTCYLLERNIIGSTQLERAGASRFASQAKALRELIERVPPGDAGDILYSLFGVLKDDFNGSMFGSRLAGERQQIREHHIQILHRFLRGDEMKTRQSVMFPLYDFRFIPIEFISAIYEDFLAAEDDRPPKQIAEAKLKSKRRKAGAYYTPPRLAELVVDIATEGWESLLTKRCLDAACGSGIFLVILFQRMAEEWRRRNPNATNTERAHELRRLLTNNLCGVDVNETACMVACFSLYLAFMDEFDDPRDIWELASEVGRVGSEKFLPPLIYEGEEGQAQRSTTPTINVANFFGVELPDLGPFDLAIGNPPWVGRNQPADEVLERWVLNEPSSAAPGNPFIRELPNCPKDEAGRRRWFLPNRQSANAFMWKVPLHVKPDGRACLLLPSKVLLANQVDDFQLAWFRRFTAQAVWQLSDYRHILFERAICPATVIKFSSQERPDDGDLIPYMVPKADRYSPRSSDLSVAADDRRQVARKEILGAAQRGHVSAVWKKHFWGTTRDQELIDRLNRMPKLAGLANRPGKGRWRKGVGFQPFHEGRTLRQADHAWWDERHLYLDPQDEPGDLILLPQDCSEIGPRFRALRRSPDRRIFAAPLVIFSRARNRIAFADFPVLFQDTTRAISGPLADHDLLLFLTAVLNSSLATYFLFHTSANWGVERETVLLDEYLQLPFPLPEQTARPETSRRIIARVAKQLKKTKVKLESLQENLFLGFREQRSAVTDAVKTELAEMVNDYYDLCDWERTLVTDTVQVFEPSSTPTSLERPIQTLRRTESQDHRTYAELLCETLNGWLGRQPWKLTAAAHIARKSGLGLLTLFRTAKPGEFSEQPESNVFEEALVRIQKAAGQSQSGIAYARGFALFEPDSFHILKPLSLRHWTRTAALNDADALMGFMARGGNG